MKITQADIDRKARFKNPYWGENEWFEPMCLRNERVLGWFQDGNGTSYYLEGNWIEVTPPPKVKKVAPMIFQDANGEWMLSNCLHSSIGEVRYNNQIKNIIWPAKFDADGFIEVPE